MLCAEDDEGSEVEVVAQAACLVVYCGKRPGTLWGFLSVIGIDHIAL